MTPCTCDHLGLCAACQADDPRPLQPTRLDCGEVSPSSAGDRPVCDCGRPALLLPSIGTEHGYTCPAVTRDDCDGAPEVRACDADGVERATDDDCDDDTNARASGEETTCTTR